MPRPPSQVVALGPSEETVERNRRCHQAAAEQQLQVQQLKEELGLLGLGYPARGEGGRQPEVVTGAGEEEEEPVPRLPAPVAVNGSERPWRNDGGADRLLDGCGSCGLCVCLRPAEIGRAHV